MTYADIIDREVDRCEVRFMYASGDPIMAITKKLRRDQYTISSSLKGLQPLRRGRLPSLSLEQGRQILAWRESGAEWWWIGEQFSDGNTTPSTAVRNAYRRALDERCAQKATP